MLKKILNHLNVIIKSSILLLALVFATFTSVGSETKVSNNNLNMSLDLNLMALRVEEDIKNDIYSAKETYTGDLTGYGADCPLCGGTLACMPSLDVLHGNVNYHDETYGDVRIVASSRNLACGTIIRFPRNGEDIVAIVLDRGVLGTAIDLLMPSEADAYKYVGRSLITYDVLRKGW